MSRTIASATTRRAFLGMTLASGGMLALGPVRAFGQASALGKFEFGVGSIDPMFCVAYVALKKGYFKDAGVEVAYLNSQSGPRTKQMLAAAQILVGASGAGDSMALTIAGKAAKLIYGFDKRITYANILVNKESYDSGKIRKVADLAGEKIAVTQPSSATWLMAVFIAERAGIKDKVETRGLNDLATMLAAVKSKQVAATVATMGMMDAAVHEGWGVPIFDVTDQKAWNDIFGGDVPGLGCYTLAESIEKRPAEVQAFVAAMVKGQDFVNANSAETLTDLVYVDYLNGFPRETVQKTLALYKDKMFLADNIIQKDAYDRLLGIMGGGRQFSAAETAQVPYEKAVDMSFVRKARGL